MEKVSSRSPEPPSSASYTYIVCPRTGSGGSRSLARSPRPPSAACNDGDYSDCWPACASSSSPPRRCFACLVSRLVGSRIDGGRHDSSPQVFTLLQYGACLIRVAGHRDVLTKRRRGDIADESEVLPDVRDEDKGQAGFASGVIVRVLNRW